MPIYEFSCPRCGERAEQFMSWEDFRSAAVYCVGPEEGPQHEPTPMKFEWGAPSFKLNGPGFHKNDYK